MAKGLANSAVLRNAAAAVFAALLVAGFGPGPSSLLSPAAAAGFGGGHSGGFGGAGFSRGYASGNRGFNSRGFAGRGFAGRASRPPISQPQIVSRAGMNRQLILPSDPNYPGSNGRNHGRSGSHDGQRINLDRYGNAYGLGYGYGFGSAGVGSGYGYGAGAASASYGVDGLAPAYAEPASFPYAPPKIIEIGTADAAGSRSQASYNGGRHTGARSGRPSLPIVTYGSSFESRASVGPGIYAYSDRQNLSAPKIVRVNVPRG